MNFDPELRCGDCGWEGDFDDTKGTRECVQCWNDRLIVLAEKCIDCGQTPDKGACYFCKMD